METSAVRKEFSGIIQTIREIWDSRLSNLGGGNLLAIATVRPHPRKVSNYISYSSGWGLGYLLAGSRVLCRWLLVMALALPVLRMERLVVVMPILSASLDFIFAWLAWHLDWRDNHGNLLWLAHSFSSAISIPSKIARAPRRLERARRSPRH